ncbi:hypothetical protein [Hymenobacter canadensis]|uniref:Uncharacterized protein n=1 Tax=Hymenobacter canadensis TaxID=2999067 RepID=A0ABY7LWF8_9BACT|nr:hypothetical protein [Hymenobacter canadensis]WBA44219.1 hypothetical protein O3303_20235 [Hymenobacter canadensis]
MTFLSTQKIRGAFCGAALGLAACQSPALPTSPPEKIFRKGRQLTYTVAHDVHQTGGLDSLMLTSFGDFKPGEYDPVTTQIKIGFSYDGHSVPGNFAGVIENDTMLWAHPPREGSYAILQLSPYPYIKLPVTEGQRWTWNLTVGSQWGHPNWGTWPGDIVVQSYYHVVGQQTVHTPMGQLRCWLVRAQAHSAAGSSNVDFLYHPTYGFVELNYHTIDGHHTNLSLAKVSMQYKMDYLGASSYQVLVP